MVQTSTSCTCGAALSGQQTRYCSNRCSAGAAAQRYRRRDRPAIKRASAKARAKIKSTKHSKSDGAWFRVAVYIRDEGLCQMKVYCDGTKVLPQFPWDPRRAPDGFTLDHIDPTGPSVLENLRLACHSCNCSKKARETA